LWKGLLLFLEDTSELEGVGIRVSYQIKRNKERGYKRPKRRKKLSPFSPIPEIMFSSFLFLSFSIDMQD
jgi:hypothetical protein